MTSQNYALNTCKPVVIMLLATLMNIGCSDSSGSSVVYVYPPIPNQPASTDPEELTPIKSEFYLLSDHYFAEEEHLRNRDVPAYFKDLGYKEEHRGTVGECVIAKYSDGSEKGKLHVDGYFWSHTQALYGDEMLFGKSRRDEARKIVVFHELGHCVLNRLKHNCAISNETRGFRDESVMNAIVINTNNFIQFFDEYIDELFINSPLFPTSRVTILGKSKSTVPTQVGCLGEESTSFPQRLPFSDASKEESTDAFIVSKIVFRTTCKSSEKELDCKHHF